MRQSVHFLLQLCASVPLTSNAARNSGEKGMLTAVVTVVLIVVCTLLITVGIALVQSNDKRLPKAANARYSAFNKALKLQQQP